MSGRSINKCEFIGNLGRDPEMRFTSGGKEQVTFSIACGRSWKTETGEAKEETDWIPVIAYDKLAQICNEYLHKGSKVYVAGRLSVRTVEAEDGTKKTYYSIVANEMMMLDGKPAGEGGGSRAAAIADEVADIPF